MLGTLALSLFLSWVQVSSDTYIVKSSAGEERARRVLKELEHFHQLIGTLVFRNTELPELPIEVLLIGDEQTMKELEPEFNGRRIAVAGYYQRGTDRDFIVLSGRVFPPRLNPSAIAIIKLNMMGILFKHDKAFQSLHSFPPHKSQGKRDALEIHSLSAQKSGG